ncbi:MAG: hypothetical protein CME69_00010 [Halobacteriovorax sp.]|nr:hypothetical protein [Halobacteriovorax sp.]
MRKILMTFLMTCSSVLATEYLPENILKSDTYLSHHILLAEKSTHKLYLYETKENGPKLIETFQVATGKKAGNKIFQGDHRTPEGIYSFTEFLPHKSLVERHGKAGEIYGVGAFVMNYPNPIDRLAGKTGGGIWLHSTNDETRIDKGLDSRGCIVAHNKNLIDLSQYIELNKTSIVVTHEVKFLKKETWQTTRDEIEDALNGWLTSWQEEDFNSYKDFYHKEKFRDYRHKNYNNYVNYKRAVFSNPGKPVISIDNVSILKTNNYAVVTFIQNYQSNTIEDVGKKTLYLVKDLYYNWKIVAEEWTKAGLEVDHGPSVAFKPRLKFFESSNPKEIFTSHLNLKDDITETAKSN